MVAGGGVSGARLKKLNDVDDFDVFFDTFGGTPQVDPFATKQPNHPRHLNFKSAESRTRSVRWANDAVEASTKSSEEFPAAEALSDDSRSSSSISSEGNRHYAYHDRRSHEEDRPPMNKNRLSLHSYRRLPLCVNSQKLISSRLPLFIPAIPHAADNNRWKFSDDEESDEELRNISSTPPQKTTIRNKKQALPQPKQSPAKQQGQRSRFRSESSSNLVKTPHDNSGEPAVHVAGGAAEVSARDKQGSRRQKIDLHPLQTYRRIASRYKLPEPSEYNYRGQLYRLKGKWKKSWSLEWFVVEHDVLLTCAKEEPFLVKLCIPLKNIQSIDFSRRRVQKKSFAGCVFEIHYIRAARNNKHVAAIVLCRASSPEEASHCMSCLRRLRDTSVGTGKTDLVTRSKAANAIQELHDSIKNGGLYQLVSRLFSAIAQRNKDLLREAFELMNRHFLLRKLSQQRELMEEKLGNTKKEVEVATILGQKQLQETKRLAALNQFAQAICRIADSKRHLAFLHLKHNTDLMYTSKVANGMQEVLLNTMIVNHAAEGLRQIQWRKKRLKCAIEKPFIRVLKDTMATIKAGSDVIAVLKESRKNALKCLLAVRESHRKEAIAIAVMRWRSTTSLYSRQQEKLKSVLLNLRNWRCHLALRRWIASSVVRSQKDIRAVTTLNFVVKKHFMKSLGVCFGRWSRWVVEEQQRETLQIAANFNMVNDQIISAYDHVPRDRACYHLGIVVERILLSRRALALHDLRYFACRKKMFVRNATVGVALLQRISRRRLIEAFGNLLKFTFRCYHSSSKRLMGVFHLVVILRVVLDRNIAQAFFCFRRGPEQRSVSLSGGRSVSRSKDAILRRLCQIMGRLQLHQCAVAIRYLKAHLHEVETLRGIARGQCLQLIVHLLGRQRMVALAAAFSRWSCSLPNKRSTSDVLIKQSDFKTSPRIISAAVKSSVKSAAVPESSQSQEHRRSIGCRSNDVDIDSWQSLPSRRWRSIMHPPDVPAANASATQRLSNLIGRRIWLGVEMGGGEEGQHKQLLLQAHRVTTRSEIQSALSDKDDRHWKPYRHHPTMRALQLKKNVLPSHLHTRISSVKGQLIRLPQGQKTNKRRTKLDHTIDLSSLDLSSDAGVLISTPPSSCSSLTLQETPQAPDGWRPAADSSSQCDLFSRSCLELSRPVLAKGDDFATHQYSTSKEFNGGEPYLIPFRPHIHTLESTAFQQPLTPQAPRRQTYDSPRVSDDSWGRETAYDNAQSYNRGHAEREDSFEVSTLGLESVSECESFNNASTPYLDYLVNRNVHDTSAREIPDIDIIRDFVFDDVQAIRAASDIDLEAHLAMADLLLRSRAGPESRCLSSTTPQGSQRSARHVDKATVKRRRAPRAATDCTTIDTVDISSTSQRQKQIARPPEIRSVAKSYHHSRQQPTEDSSTENVVRTNSSNISTEVAKISTQPKKHISSSQQDVTSNRPRIPKSRCNVPNSRPSLNAALSAGESFTRLTGKLPSLMEFEAPRRVGVHSQKNRKPVVKVMHVAVGNQKASGCPTEPAVLDDAQRVYRAQLLSITSREHSQAGSKKAPKIRLVPETGGSANVEAIFSEKSCSSDFVVQQRGTVPVKSPIKSPKKPKMTAAIAPVF